MRIGKHLTHHFYWGLNYYLLPHPRHAFKRIDQAICSMANITKRRHLYGSIEWRYKNKPIGHIHGNRVVDILFPKDIQSSLLLDGRVKQNMYAKNGISLYLRTNEDIDFAIEILSYSYNLVKSKTDRK